MWKDFILGDGSKVVKKIEINGKVAFKRKSYTDTEFTGCPFPTSWIVVTTGTNYKATNDYGEWNIEASDYQNNGIDRAFDNNGSVPYDSGTSIPREFGIILPSKVTIKPTSFYLRYRYTTSTDVLQGYDEQTSSWIEISKLKKESGLYTHNISYSGDKFFSKFRIYSTEWFSSSRKKIYFYLFSIDKGIIRTEV